MTLCPVCSKTATVAYAPFCSDRCRLVDLNRWFIGAYSSPAIELDDVDTDEITSSDLSEH